MKKLIPLLMLVVAFAACEKDPDMGKLDNKYLVYTNYDTKADFKAFQTYYLPDSILIIGDKKEATYWKDDNAQEILKAYADNMNSRGYLRVDIQTHRSQPRPASQLHRKHLLLPRLRSPRMVVELSRLLGCTLLGQLGRMVLPVCRDLYLQHRSLHHRDAQPPSRPRRQTETAHPLDQLHERTAQRLQQSQYTSGSGRRRPSIQPVRLSDKQITGG